MKTFVSSNLIDDDLFADYDAIVSPDIATTITINRHGRNILISALMAYYQDNGLYNQSYEQLGLIITDLLD